MDRPIVRFFDGRTSSAYDEVIFAADRVALLSALRLAWQRQNGYRVFGARHSFDTDVDGHTAIIFWSPGKCKLQRTGYDLFRIPACCVWEDVERQLEPFGMSCPVLTSETRVTVGGSLFAGGFGERTLNRGSQLSAAVSLHVIRADGSFIYCSPAQFLQMNAGSEPGRRPVIESVLLRAERRRACSYVAVKVHDDVVDLIADLLTLLNSDGVENLDSYKGQHYRDRFLSTIAQDVDDFEQSPTTLITETGRIVTRELDWHRRMIASPRTFNLSSNYIWRDFVMPDAAALKFAEYLQTRVVSNKVYRQARGRMLFLAARSRLGVTEPWVTRFLSPTTHAIGFGIYLEVGEDSEDLTAARRLQGENTDFCRQLGGVSYPQTAF